MLQPSDFGGATSRIRVSKGAATRTPRRGSQRGGAAPRGGGGQGRERRERKGHRAACRRRFCVPQPWTLLSTPRRGCTGSHRVCLSARGGGCSQLLPSPAAARLLRRVQAPECVWSRHHGNGALEAAPGRWELRTSGPALGFPLPRLFWRGRSGLSGRFPHCRRRGHLHRVFPEVGAGDHMLQGLGSLAPARRGSRPTHPGLPGRGGAADTGQTFILFRYLFSGG